MAETTAESLADHPITENRTGTQDTIFESMAVDDEADAVLAQLEELNMRFRASFSVDSELVPRPQLDQHRQLLEQAKQMLEEVLAQAEIPDQRASVLGGITAGLAIGTAVHQNRDLMRQHYQALRDSIGDAESASGKSQRQLWLAKILGDLLEEGPDVVEGAGLKSRVWRRYQRKFGKNAETFRHDWRALWRRNRDKTAA
jgi:hypothetical protein